MRAATYAPISVNNNVGTNGMLMAMDLLTYGTGSAGGVLAVRNFSAYSRPVTALTGQQNHFSAAFTPGNAQGFALTINGIVDPSLDDESNNVYRATTSTDGGILIAPNSNTVTPNPALPGTFFIAFATFERTLTAAELPINGNRLYRLQFTARTTVPNAQLAPTVRVRFNAGPVVPGTTIPQADFTQEIVLESVGGETAMHLPTGPTARTYTSFFAIPTELSGGISKISLDAYPSGIPGDFAPGGVVFEAVNVASFDFPLP
jgi:hypothetical protein